MSTLDIIEENLEATIARQQAGRVTREECVEAMARALFRGNMELEQCEECFASGPDGLREHAAAALDAAIASGYVVRP